VCRCVKELDNIIRMYEERERERERGKKKGRKE